MDLVSRLKQYLNTHGIGITQFADECMIPRPTASQLLAGRNKKVSDEIIGKIHHTYPELSVTWLMFGEGDMEIKPSKSNIAETQSAATDSPMQASDTVHSETIDNGLFSVSDSEEKMSTETIGEEFTFAGNTFTFTPQSSTFRMPSSAPVADAERPSMDKPIEQQPKETSSRHITLTPEKGKCVTGIMVYYSDSTFESFVPDPDAKLPFMR